MKYNTLITFLVLVVLNIIVVLTFTASAIGLLNLGHSVIDGAVLVLCNIIPTIITTLPATHILTAIEYGDAK